MIAIPGTRNLRANLMKAASMAAVAAGMTFAAANLDTAQALVARDDVGATAIRDTNNAWPWVGQFITWDNRASASFGLCTAQVINPRVVLLAAHCVGGAGGTEIYGNGAGRRDAAVMFNPNNLAALRKWIGFDSSTAAVGASNELDRVYRVIDLIAHPRNTLNSFAAGNADVMIAVLDAPVNGFNGYGMLFSPLTALETVDLVGYGNQGTMSTGQISIDWWRRAGQNALGFLGSDNDVFGSDLFGNDPPAAGWAGDLYWVDSDSHLNPRPAGDFNIFGGAALPNEVGIAQGDSGGAMWIRRNGVPIAIGVESYGYSFGPRFGQGAITAATALFPYWDFIVANNAYVYAAAKTGGGAWEAGATWVQMLDPSYLTIGAGGAIVNALPTTDPVSDSGGGANVGGVRPLPVNPVPNSNPAAADVAGDTLVASALGDTLGGVRDAIGNFSLQVTLDGTAGSSAAPADTSLTASLDATAIDRPAPDAAVGGVGSGFWPVGVAPLSGPGSSNFVPSNTNGVVGTQFANAAKFFEVQLVNSGVVTLSSARTIDRLRIMAAQAGLTINAGASLTTVMSASVEAGTLVVNGTLRSRGFGLIAGTLSGSGLIQASGGVGISGAAQTAGTSAITSGVVAPGGIGAVGTLSFQGNVAFAGGGLAIDIASATSFDRIAVANLAGATGTNGTFTSPTTGTLPSIGISFLGGFLPTAGQTYAIITASGGVTGSFSVANTLPGVLFATYAASGTTGSLTIQARPYTTATSYLSAEQVEMARALDYIRAVGGNTAMPLLALTDVTAIADLPATFEALSPLNQFAATGLTEASTSLIAESLGGRSDQLASGGGHGFEMAGLEALGLGVQVASDDPFDAMMMGASAVAAAQEAAAETAGKMGFALKEGWGGFLEIRGLVNSEYEVTPFAGDSDLTGLNGTLGFDYSFADDQAFVGGALSYSTGKAKLAAPLQQVDADNLGISVYGGVREGDSFFTGYLGFSAQAYDLTRTVFLPGSTQTLTAQPDGSTWIAGAKAGIDFDIGQGTITPFAGLDAMWNTVDGYTEQGGSAAFIVPDRDTTLIDGRIGLAYKGLFDLGDGSVLRPKLSVAYAIDVQSDDNVATAAFLAFPSAPLTFVGSERDSGWAEYEVGLEYEGSGFGAALSYSGADNGVLTTGVVTGRLSVAW